MNIYTIKDIYRETSTIFKDMEQYSGKAWFDEIVNIADDYIQLHYPTFEILRCYSDRYITETLNNIYRAIRVCIYTNVYTFSKMYETTQLEYNPLFNVDGTEKTERIYSSINDSLSVGDVNSDISDISKKDLTSTRSLTVDDKRDVDTTYSDEYTENETSDTTTSSSDTKSGTDATTFTDNRTDTITYNSKNTQDRDISKNISNTTDNSSTLYLASSEVESGDITDTKSGNDKTVVSDNSTNTIEYNSKNTISGSSNTENEKTTTGKKTENVTDKYNSTNTDENTSTENFDDKRKEFKHLNSTDNSKRDDTESILVTKQGNIGITKSTDLIDSQRLTVQFNYIEFVCDILIRKICNTVY